MGDVLLWGIHKLKTSKREGFTTCGQGIQEQEEPGILQGARREAVLRDNLSKYGYTNKAEFFAEVFANSQLSEPNELGKAMNIWLERKGLIQ